MANQSKRVKENLAFYRERRCWTYQGRRYDSFLWFQEMLSVEFWENATKSGIFSLPELPIPSLEGVVNLAREVCEHTEMFEVYRIKIDELRESGGKVLDSEAANIFMLFEEYMDFKSGNFRSSQAIKIIFKKWSMDPDLYHSINDPLLVDCIKSSVWMRSGEESLS